MSNNEVNMDESIVNQLANQAQKIKMSKLQRNVLGVVLGTISGFLTWYVVVKGGDNNGSLSQQ